MKLIERAQGLSKAGLLPSSYEKNLQALVTKAEKDFGDLVETAPATALLSAAGEVLAIPADIAAEIDGYASVLSKIQAFCRNAFTLSDVTVKPVKGRTVQVTEEETAKVLSIRYRIDGEKREVEVTHFPDLIDLSFVGDLDSHLETIKSSRRLIPLMEMADDTARYLFCDPKAFRTAEKRSLIEKPEWMSWEDD